ncbi:MAG: hypothetical protein J2P40_01280 [Candidatus Dormibacteraeota bacterium]|nr:hypothetical protein [Candidatus Dormibacteraeota bacterium]MBO0759881.1 hypothetical protein [Candidatus Dormibacteraeota bacterium]
MIGRLRQAVHGLRPPDRHMGVAPTDDPDRRSAALQGLCFCFLYDLCAWLSGGNDPVPSRTSEYTLTHLRPVPDPRRRLQRYVNPRLLESWDAALAPFFGRGLLLVPDLAADTELVEEGRRQGGALRADLRFLSRSSLRDGPRFSPLPTRRWQLTLWVSPDLARVDDAAVRAA